ncbi:hypothetical protein SLEP1_g58705 [Rubroshorea leprosula]|uniref:Uncharacterized protein n=1 Tax=Rubroshorea leprosula TaxID=152421 RepID=A0AAV5MRP9_9ROSI|nr:hypothetical protein SLEP1_g58705 [Rubroshorea leprosula]
MSSEQERRQLDEKGPGKERLSSLAAPAARAWKPKNTLLKEEEEEGRRERSSWVAKDTMRWAKRVG